MQTEAAQGEIKMQNVQFKKKKKKQQRKTNRNKQTQQNMLTLNKTCAFSKRISPFALRSLFVLLVRASQM